MKAGYKGRDQMREKAEKAIGKAVRGAEKPAKMSASAPDKIPPRIYKKGGSVKRCDTGGMVGSSNNASSFTPSALPSSPNNNASFSFKKGGKVKCMAMGGVGKIRHNEMGKSKKHKKMKEIF